MSNRRSPNKGAVKVSHLLASGPHRNRLLVARNTLCIFANEQMHVSKVCFASSHAWVRPKM